MKLYNTMNRQKEEFIPITPNEAKIYTCGPTVYNYFHIGNARPFIIFDTLRRYLEYRGYQVTYVQNFTDIDDKMINKANEEGITVQQLADRYIAEYYQDAHALGIRDATVAPRATEHMAQIIALIEDLIARGLAYAVDGDVYYSARKFDEYGKLSGQNLEELESGARVDVSEEKQDALDFALWKSQKPGEPAWDSPWGKGRPGWHIECSAMSMEYLGDNFDIHCGGQDLIFPHHENEIAQSEGATGHHFANYWMHNGYLNIDNKKMSKSLGNFFTVREILAEYDAMAVRMLLLSAQYRSPINFSRELVDAQANALERIRNAAASLSRAIERKQAEADAQEQALLGALDEYKQRFIAAMDDDLNTADALAEIFDLVRAANTVYASGGSWEGAVKTLELLNELSGVLGIETAAVQQAVPEEILQLAQQRDAARKEKNWAKADELRDAIAAAGYTLEDTPDGPLLKKK
ncbi:cysteine--tRNA ligase [Eubacteriales bacterium OttesenSCG-928-N14]|nr:cysteine--tRNA ligase [Eubacteriales bacterium OttesenSCG-928-N14]